MRPAHIEGQLMGESIRMEGWLVGEGTHVEGWLMGERNPGWSVVEADCITAV